VGEYEENEKNKGNESFKAKEYAAVRASMSLSHFYLFYFLLRVHRRGPS
jgi:hypothetical protein